MINEQISTYNKKADQLFSEWKSIQGIVCSDNGTISIDHKNNVFIRDSVVCHETWFSQKIRPLFLLKEAYGGTEDWDLIKDKDRLKSQFKIYDPTIIICGYTSSYLETIFDKDFREPRNDNLYYHIELNGHDLLVIDYWHPANHYPDLMNHYSFLGIYQNSLTTPKD